MDFGINLNAQYANGVTHFKSVAKSGKGMCFDIDAIQLILGYLIVNLDRYGLSSFPQISWDHVRDKLDLWIPHAWIRSLTNDNATLQDNENCNFCIIRGTRATLELQAQPLVYNQQSFTCQKVFKSSLKLRGTEHLCAYAYNAFSVTFRSIFRTFIGLVAERRELLRVLGF